ncbi:MAG: hypothetical protein AAFZ87_03555, partial [Planctomycetota bacterium]
MRFVTFGALASLVASAATAQDQVRVPAPVPGAPTFVGTVDALTGELRPTAGLLGAREVLYANNVFLGQFLALDPGEVLIDEGRIPSTVAPTVVGTFDSYALSSVQVGYATDADGTQLGGTGVRLRIELFESYGTCASRADSDAPLLSVEFDAPGSASGAIEAFTVDVDVSGLGLCMRADGDGQYSDGVGDLFGWSFEVIDPGVGVVDGTGPLLACDPNVAPVGDGTAFQNAAAAAGSGLGTRDAVQVTGTSGPACIWFGGFPANNFASFWMVVEGDADAGGDCIGCGLGDDRFEDNDAAATAAPLAFGAYRGLVCDVEDDWYAVQVAPGQELEVDALFATSVADLDLYLFDAATMVELDRGFTASDDEEVAFSNCGADPVDLLVLVDSFTGTCNTYDLVLSDPADLDDRFEDSDTCQDAVPLPLDAQRELVVRRGCSLDADYFAVTLADGETLTVDVLFDGGAFNVSAALFDITVLGCPGVAVAVSNGDTSNEHIEFTNGTGADQELVLGIGLADAGTAPYELLAKVTGTPTVGELICLGEPNSATDGARVCAVGSSAAGDNDVTFEVSGLPNDVFGFFVVSKEIGLVSPATSQGTLCVASLAIGRYDTDILGSASTGSFSFQ